MTDGAHGADVLIIGGGIAGASLAARLSAHATVTILEMEDQPGYHATGRSAAMFEPTYGPPVIRDLTRASAAYLLEGRFLTPRGVLLAGEPGDEAALEAALADDFVRISEHEALALLPRLKPDKLIGYLWDDAAQDIDVDLLHQHVLRQHRRSGGRVICAARVTSAKRIGSRWHVSTSTGAFDAPTVVIAAGAWADQVGAVFGACAIGLQPKRRSAALIPPPQEDVSRWPQFFPVREDFYIKPMGGALMLSPAEADPVAPHDASADDMRLAEAAEAMSRVLDLEVSRIIRSWAGLRSFVADGNPVMGFDPAVEDLFWLAGQGGYGIQTSPALSDLAADVLLGRAEVPVGLSPARLAAQRPDRHHP